MPATENARDSIHLSRRQALTAAAIAGLVSAFPRSLLAAADTRQGIPYRELGKTAEHVSAIGVGGHHIGRQKDPQESVRIIRSGLDRGVNFLDNCWDYHEGVSEQRMGDALKDGYRDKAFVMSKIDGRDKKTAAKQIDESLQRLGLETIDLMQMHEIIRPEDPRWSFEKGGMAAMLEAKQAGKIRYLGFTGHKSPDVHVSMLDAVEANGYPLDAVQMPLNVMDAHFHSFVDLVVPRLVKNEIAVLGMKSMGAGLILDSKTVTPAECQRYAMSLPTATVIIGCEKMEYLDDAIATAKSFKPMTEDELTKLLAKTAQAASNGEFEKYKTSRRFDGTHKNPGWLGDVPESLA